MLRIALIDIFLFSLPFLLYGAYMVSVKGVAPASLWQGAPVFWLLAAGCGLLLVTMATLIQFSGGKPGGVYHPPTVAGRRRQAGRDRLTAGSRCPSMFQSAPPRHLRSRTLNGLSGRKSSRVFSALSKEGVTTRAVGGAVRNTLLGLPVTEIDLATTALPDHVMALARAAGLKAVPTGIEHGTVTVIADGMPFEVTTLRRDVETYGRHATVAFTEDWEEDARRRDFTLNALYADRDGTVFDPLGGYGDLVAGRVRFIGEAEDAHQGGLFAHPPLLPLQRLLRQGLARSRRPCGLRAAPRRVSTSFRRNAWLAELRRILVAPQSGASGRGSVRLRAAHGVARRCAQR